MGQDPAKIVMLGYEDVGVLRVEPIAMWFGGKSRLLTMMIRCG